MRGVAVKELILPIALIAAWGVATAGYVSFLFVESITERTTKAN